MVHLDDLWSNLESQVGISCCCRSFWMRQHHLSLLKQMWQAGEEELTWIKSLSVHMESMCFPGADSRIARTVCQVLLDYLCNTFPWSRSWLHAQQRDALHVYAFAFSFILLEWYKTLKRELTGSVAEWVQICWAGRFRKASSIPLLFTVYRHPS